MLFILDKKMNPVGVANFKSPKGLPYFNDTHHEAIESNLNVLEFDVPANNPLSSMIEEEGYIIYTDMDNRQQLYVVKRFVESWKDDSLMTVSCEHASTGDLLNCFIKPMATMNSYSLHQAMTYALTTADWTLGNVADLGLQDVQFDKYITVKEAINEIAKIFGAELEFEVVFDGAVVKEKIIHVIEERGQKTGVVLEVTRDITEIEREVNTDSLITAVYAVGKDGLTLVDLPDQNDPRYKIKEDFIEDIEAFQDYNVNGRHKFGLYEDDSTNAIELFRNARDYLKVNNTPKFTYTVSMVTLERLTGYSHKAIRIGDTIVIKDFKNRPNEPLILEARVIDVKRSKTDPTQDEVILGDYVPVQFSQSSEITRLQGVVEVTEKQVNEVREATTPEAIKDVVITSQDFQTIVDNKADSSQLEDYVQTIDMEKTVEEINQSVDDKIEQIDFTPYATKAEVEQTAESLDIKFSSSGGVNLIRNSVGYAGTDFWEITLDEDAYGEPIGSVDTTHSSDVEEFGVGSGLVLKGATLRQTITVTQQVYTLSAIVKKGASGTGHIKVYDGEEAHVQYFTVNNAVDYQKYQLTFTPSANSVIVELYGDIASEIIFTGVMFNIGQVALQWQHSAGEVYNTNVLMDMNGIRVVSNQYEGYTAITPEEFAGYAEVYDQDTGQMEMKRVFTLNKDVTEVAKLDAEQEINMTPIKIVPVNSTTIKGWAFVKE